MMRYIMSASDKPCRFIEDSPEGGKFWLGTKITAPVHRPYRYTLYPFGKDEWEMSSWMPPMFSESVPLFSNKLINALQTAGVNNFQTFPAEIVDPDNDAINTDYQAVNVLGLVACADMDKSQATIHDGIPLIDVSFDKLVVDEEACHGFDLFRMAECVSELVVNERVRTYLQENGFRDELMFEPADGAMTL